MSRQAGKVFQIGIHFPIQICKPIPAVVAKKFGVAFTGNHLQSTVGAATSVPENLYIGPSPNNLNGLVIGGGTGNSNQSTYQLTTVHGSDEFNIYEDGTATSGSIIGAYAPSMGVTLAYYGAMIRKKFQAREDVYINQIGIYGSGSAGGSPQLCLLRMPVTGIPQVRVGDVITITNVIYVNTDNSSGDVSEQDPTEL